VIGTPLLFCARATSQAAAFPTIKHFVKIKHLLKQVSPAQPINSVSANHGGAR
jgi:hypothetical protein